MKKWKKFAALGVTAVMSATALSSLTACGGTDLKPGYRTYTSVMPSNWNELTYADNNDVQIMEYIKTELFTFDYEFDESKGGKFTADGKVNADAIVENGYSVKYLAATALEDVTSAVDAKWGYTDKQKDEGGYAWKITLRDDLVWEDGTKIKAADFVYSMEQQLDPAFQNMRAATYYINTPVKGAKNYVYQGMSGWFDASTALGTYSEEDDDKLVFAVTQPYNNVYGSFVDAIGGKGASAAAIANFLSGYGVQITEEVLTSMEGKTLAEIKADATMKAAWESLIGWWQTEPDEELHFFVAEASFPEMDFEDVGYYAESEYSFVVCFESSIQALKEDGSLSYHAAYEMASFPLVKKDLYESCKKAPQEGSTLWTSNYNSSLATTASWGPYKLTEFQGGKQYTLSRNDNWFGYALDDFKDQYQVTSIVAECMPDINTQWMSFLQGNLDEIALDLNHKDDYRNSKYTFYAPNTGTFGVNIYSNLDVLKNNGKNNAVLAIKDFREAIALYLDRDDYNATCYASHKSCYGLLGPAYYYDVENSGVYRETKEAKEGLLRVYGFTENGDGTWSDGTNSYADYEKAYAAMNGMNRTLAKEKVEAAYTELTTNAEKYGYDSSKKIIVTFGCSVDNEATRRHYNYYSKLFDELLSGTSFEGKLDFRFDASFGSNWSNDFKAGSYEFAAGTGFSGGPFDPAGTMQCYLDPDAGLMYPTWWNTKTDMIEFTMPEGDYDGAGQTITKSAYNWYACLNGIADEGDYNWGAGIVPETVRLRVLSMLEEHVLNQYFTIVTTSEYGATVTSAKFSFISEEYNTFMGFGGYRYMRQNYDDAEWNKFVKKTNLENEYKKTN